MPRARSCPVLLLLLLVALAGAAPAGGCGGDDAPAAPDAAPEPTVGPEGGTLVSGDGRATLVVPPGALEAPAVVQLLSVRTALLPLSAEAVVDAAYRIVPEELRFAEPATLSVAYALDDGPVGARDEELALFTVTSQSWAPIATSTVDPPAHVATAPIEGGGAYGVAWRGPPGPCAAPEDAQFDFWVGDWDWVDAGGQVVAQNRIRRAPGGCVVREEFNGGTGRSISFRGDDGRWNQTYVQRDLRLEMSGAWDGSRMTLAVSPSLRFYWRPRSSRVVEYNQELSSDGGATWRLGTETEYRRR